MEAHLIWVLPLSYVGLGLPDGPVPPGLPLNPWSHILVSCAGSLAIWPISSQAGKGKGGHLLGPGTGPSCMDSGSLERCPGSVLTILPRGSVTHAQHHPLVFPVLLCGWCLGNPVDRRVGEGEHSFGSWEAPFQEEVSWEPLDAMQPTWSSGTSGACDLELTLTQEDEFTLEMSVSQDMA